MQVNNKLFATLAFGSFFLYDGCIHVKIASGQAALIRNGAILEYRPDLPVYPVDFRIEYEATPYKKVAVGQPFYVNGHAYLRLSDKKAFDLTDRKLRQDFDGEYSVHLLPYTLA